MILLNYKGILFDDWSEEEIEGKTNIWAEMCEEHALKYKKRLKQELDDGGVAQGCCSVYECDANGHDLEKSHYYVDLNCKHVRFVVDFKCQREYVDYLKQNFAKEDFMRTHSRQTLAKILRNLYPHTTSTRPEAAFTSMCKERQCKHIEFWLKLHQITY